MKPLLSIRTLPPVAEVVRFSPRSFESGSRIGAHSASSGPRACRGAKRQRGPTPGHAFAPLKRGDTFGGGLPPHRDRAGPARPRSGFTLLEILLCIALIALLGGVLIGGSSHLLSDQPVTPHGVFWKSVQEARKAALKSQREVRLKFDRDKKHFYLVDGLAPTTLADDGITRVETPLKIFPVPAESAQDLTIDFLAASTKGGNAILVGGVLLESRTISFVTFYPDGTCSAFRAQFARSSGNTILSIDPWTCAPVLTPADPNAPPST